MPIIKKTKRNLVFILVTLLAMNAHATVKEGLYFGAGVGETFNKFDLTTTNLSTSFTVKNKPNKNKVVGNVFLGYGTTMENGFYFGGEVGSYFPSRSVTTTRPGVSFTNFRYTNTLGIQDYVTADLLPGFRINEDWLLYARAGLTYAHTTFAQAASLQVAAYRNENNKIGGRIGAGINFSIVSHLGIGLDYFYTRYANMNSHLAPFNIQFTQKTASNYLGLSATYTV